MKVATDEQNCTQRLEGSESENRVLERDGGDLIRIEV